MRKKSDCFLALVIAIGIIISGCKGGNEPEAVDIDYILDHAVESASYSEVWICGPYVYLLSEKKQILSKLDERTGYVFEEDISSAFNLSGRLGNWLVYDDCLYYTMSEGSWGTIAKYTFGDAEPEIITDHYWMGITGTDEALKFASRLVLYNENLYYISYDYDVAEGKYFAHLHKYGTYTEEDLCYVEFGAVDDYREEEVALYKVNADGLIMMINHEQGNDNYNYFLFDPNSNTFSSPDVSVDIQVLEQAIKENEYSIEEYAMDQGIWDDLGMPFEGGVVFSLTDNEARKIGCGEGGIYVVYRDDINTDNLKQSSLVENSAIRLFRKVEIIGVLDSGKIIIKDKDDYYAIDAFSGEAEEYSILQ